MLSDLKSKLPDVNLKMKNKPGLLTDHLSEGHPVAFRGLNKPQSKFRTTYFCLISNIFFSSIHKVSRLFSVNWVLLFCLHSDGYKDIEHLCADKQTKRKGQNVFLNFSPNIFHVHISDKIENTLK